MKSHVCGKSLAANHLYVLYHGIVTFWGRSIGRMPRNKDAVILPPRPATRDLILHNMSTMGYGVNDSRCQILHFKRKPGICLQSRIISDIAARLLASQLSLSRLV